MGKLSIVKDSNSENDKLKINVADRKIYYNTEEGLRVLIEGTLKYRPLHCSELSRRLANRDWNKSETLFIQGDSNVDDPILKYKKYTTTKPIGEIDEIDTLSNDQSLSFPLCGDISSEEKEYITEVYSSIFDNTMTAKEEVCFMGSSKSVMNTSEGQESIDLITGLDSYTSSLSLCELIEYSSYPRISARVDISIKYSKLNNDMSEASIYNYFTTFKAFGYNKDRKLEIENMVEIISDNTEDLIRIEYLGGIIKLFPVSPRITECIINDCTVIYGKFR
jgi:hypothetical protein